MRQTILLKLINSSAIHAPINESFVFNTGKIKIKMKISHCLKC